MEIPKGAISWLVNRMHVSTTTEEVKADIRARCTTAGWTEKKIVEAENYAVRCHDENRTLYRAVTTGRL